MQRFKLLVFCLLAMASASTGAETIAAQSASEDTLQLDLTTARRLALLGNPELLAERQLIGIARGQATQAEVYRFNPRLSAEAPGAATGRSEAPYEARLTQEIEWAGQRGLRISAARQGLERSDAAVRDAARELLGVVGEAFFEAVAGQRRVDLAFESLGLTEQLLRVTRIQATEGEISQLEANLAEIEFGRSRARVLSAEREALSARLELQRLIGLPPTQVVRLADDAGEPTSLLALSPDSVLRLALAHRPDLEARERAIEESRALLSLARREAIPNLELGAIAERDAAGGDPRVGFALSIPVPFWNRNQGVVAERAALTAQAVHHREAVELAIRTEVTDAYRAVLTATEESRVYETEVLQPTQANQALLEAAFVAGKVGLPTLLLLRNQLLDAEIGYWDTWLAARRAQVRLEVVTGTLAAPANLQPSSER